jgi:hypothetical protein
MAAAAERKQELYVFQCTADTRPEDLLVTPVLSQSGTIAYHASPLVTAMIRGAVCVLDEGNRMNEKSWASLAPLFDQRRYVESIVAGIESRRFDLRDSGLHTQPLTTDLAAWVPESAGRVSDFAVSLAVR